MMTSTHRSVTVAGLPGPEGAFPSCAGMKRLRGRANGTSRRSFYPAAGAASCYPSFSPVRISRSFFFWSGVSTFS